MIILQPWMRALNQVRHMRIHVSKTIENTKAKMLDAFVDSVFEFVDQSLLPCQVRDVHLQTICYYVTSYSKETTNFKLSENFLNRSINVYLFTFTYSVY